MSLMDLLVRGDVAGVTERVRAKPAELRAIMNTPWGPMEPLLFVSNAPFSGLRLGGVAPELARALLAEGAPVEGTDSSILSSAVSLGATEVARVLVQHGADLEHRGTYPGLHMGTPLDHAVHFGMVDCIDMLVAHGAVVHDLRMAAGAGDVDRVRAAWTDADRPSQLDAFRVAVVCGRAEIVRFMLAHGRSVHDILDTGGTALHWAAWEARSRMASLLLQEGASTTVTDESYQLTPLGWAQVRLEQVGPHQGHADLIAVLTRA